MKHIYSTKLHYNPVDLTGLRSMTMNDFRRYFVPVVIISDT